MNIYEILCYWTLFVFCVIPTIFILASINSRAAIVLMEMFGKRGWKFMLRTQNSRKWWRFLGRPHWNIYLDKGSWQDTFKHEKGGEGQCAFCDQYALFQFNRMRKCPMGPEKK